MACSIGTPRPSRVVDEIAGTWDFKWPLGTKVRVAFQRPPRRAGCSPEDQARAERAFEQARLEVIRLASRWHEAVSEALTRPGQPLRAVEFLRRGISLSFPDELILEAPDASTPILGNEHRSPFLTEDARARPYDVLVSLEDLPINRIDPFRFAGPSPKDQYIGERRGLDRVTMPRSELGCYARTVDYGLPTIYLGRFGKLTNVDLLQYLRSEMGQHIVVHEFGHVLGLAHEHQNPHYPDTFYRDPAEIRESIVKHNGMNDGDVTVSNVIETIVGRWPGSPEFSDWGVPPNTTESLYALDSIMAAPFHRTFLREDLIPESLKQATANIGWHTHPRPTDVANLIRMYCPAGVELLQAADAAQQ